MTSIYQKIIVKVSFQIEMKSFPKGGNLTKTFLLGTFWTITLGVYNLLGGDLIQKWMRFGG